MKRLIALAIAALFSVFAGIEFVLPKDDDFYFNPKSGVGDYFQVANSDEDIQYRQLYRQVRGYTSDAKEQCDITRRQEQRPEWYEINDRYKSKKQTSNFSAGIWEPVYVAPSDGIVNVKIIDSSTIEYTLTGAENIYAPVAGNINTSHFACEYGHYMEYVASLSNGTTYTMTIKNAKCWYCCANKTPPEDGRYTATTSDSLKGQAMRLGDMLCVGQSGTVVTVRCTTP